MRRYIYELICLCVLLSSCSNQQQHIPRNTLFTKLSSDTTGIDFSNTITESQSYNLFNYRNFYNGGGVGLIDVNNDGLLDIYFTANQQKNRLYLNEGNLIFRDITETAGVSGRRPWSTAVAVADVNGDSLMDMYVLNSGDIAGGNRRNELFINQGDLTFKEEAKAYNLDDNGFTTHASFFDYDGDGDLDAYLLNNSFTGQNMKRLFGKNREISDVMGGDKLLRNDAVPNEKDRRKFTDVSKEAGIYSGELGFGLGIAIGDINGDLRPDIYISNDFWERDYLYINRGDCTFSEELVRRTSHISQSSMGNDIADINNDGRQDIFTTDMLPVDIHRTKTMTVFDDYHFEDPKYHGSYHHQYVQNALQVNNGNGTFREIGFMAGVAATDWSWAATIFDFDNDGWKDMYVTNGVYRDITDMDFQNFLQDKNNIANIVRETGTFNVFDFLDRIPSKKIGNFAFLNNKDSTFLNRSDSLGFYEPSFSNGAAYGDLDNDGDLDLVVNNLEEKAFVYRNNAEKRLDNHFLKVKFDGDERNPFGIGAYVKIYAQGSQQVAENIPGRSFQSTVSPYLHFGLGSNGSIDSLLVVWPDHQMQVLKNVKADREITLRKESANRKFIPPAGTRKGKDPVIRDITGKSITGDIKLNENKYSDFDDERLLPHMLSTEGPKLATGDIDGNGLEDFFVTGSSGNKDKMFIQQRNGAFSQSTSPDLERDSTYESTAGAFLDIDGDGDLDLIVANGGNQFALNSDYNKVRAYENNGKGVFRKAMQMAPDININASCLIVDDYDSDGDSDIFIGARAVPQNYGINPESYLLENDGKGNWTDVTPKRLKRAGMITGAVWADHDSDGDDDLVVVGEWMPVTVFSNRKGTLRFDVEIKNSSGWWTSIKKADLDEDGDMDFVLGNWGLNSKFKASENEPLTMFVNDFDGNGQTEFIINAFLPGEDSAYPFPSYEDLTAVLPVIKERIQNHHEYAGKTYEEILSTEQRRGAEKKEVQTLHSSLLINNDNGNFELTQLPIEAQVSPVYGIIPEDFNSDSNMDLLLLGNIHGLKPEVGRLASNYGVFLFDDGNLSYRFQPYYETNTFIKGEVRDASIISGRKKRRILIARNDDELLIFE